MFVIKEGNDIILSIEIECLEGYEHLEGIKTKFIQERSKPFAFVCLELKRSIITTENSSSKGAYKTQD